MTENKVNSDLMKCENNFYIESNQTKSLLITKKARQSVINCTPNAIKTERLSSNVLSRAKDFLSLTKDTANEPQMCDLVVDKDESEDQCSGDGKPVVELDFVLFANKDQTDGDNEEEEDTSDSSEESDSDEDTDKDSDDTTSDGVNQLIKEDNHTDDKSLP